MTTSMSPLERHPPARAGRPLRRARAARLLALALLAAAAPAPAAHPRDPAVQDEPRAVAQLSSGVARVGEPVHVRVVLENAQRATIGPLPEVAGLTFSRPSAPSSETSWFSSGGRRQVLTSVSWVISVRGERPGEFEIPPIPIEVGGALVRTAPLTLRVVRDLHGEELGFLEVATQPAGRLVDGQPFTLEIRFGWDAAADVNYANLVLSWWGTLYGALDLGERELPPGAKEVQGVLINRRLSVTVEELPPATRDGRTFRNLRLVRSFLATRSGTMEIPSSVLEFGKVRSGGLLGMSQELVRELFVQSPPLALEVLPLPTEGQPFDYGGAVGTLAARATVDARDVRAGDSVKLTVTWTGAGNLEFFEAPDPSRLEAFAGFRYYGKTEEKAFDRRVATYDLAPLSPEVEEIPPLPLQVFDPELGAYTSVTTEPIPIRVRPLEGGGGLDAPEERSFGPDVRDLDARPLAEGAGWDAAVAPGDAQLLAGLVLVPCAWLGLRTAVRRRRGDPGAPLERRRRRARRRLARELSRASAPSEQLAAFTTFLAARTREPEAAWIGRGTLLDGAPSSGEAAATVSAPANGAGVHGDGLPPADLGVLPADERRSLRALLERLEAAVYGGGAPVADQELLGAAERLVRAGL